MTSPTMTVVARSGGSTPDAIVNLAGAINRADYWAEGRGVNQLGLAGMNAKEIKAFLKTGNRS